MKHYKKWLKENPDGTPYDALIAEVITQEEFQALTDESEKAPAKQKPKEKEEKKPAKPIIKQTGPATAPAQADGMAVLVNLKSGKRTRMALHAVHRMVRKYPKIYAQG